MVLAVNDLLQFVYNPTYTISRDEKVVRSIGDELAKMFTIKRNKLVKTVDLINRNKKISISLAYYQIWALHQLIYDLIALFEGKPYVQLQLQKTLNLLDGKLQ